MSVSNSDLRGALAAGLLLLAGCEGPWDGLPSGEADAPRASVAVFLQAGLPATATFSRPLAGQEELLSRIRPWIDTARSRIDVFSSSDRCRRLDSLGWTKIVYRNVFLVGWERSLESVSADPGPGCPDSLSRIRGVLRWNASLPWDSTGPWTTDSFQAQVQVSTAPTFVHGPLLAALDLRWPALAEADSATRADWAASPRNLAWAVQQWSTYRRRLGLDTQVLVLRRDGLYSKADLDTGVLGSALRRSPVLGVFTPAVPGDTLYLYPGGKSYLIPSVQGAEGHLFYISTTTGFRLEAVPVAQWGEYADWTSIESRGGDPWRDWVPVLRPDGCNLLQSVPSERDRIQVAVAGTCLGQRAWLAGGTSTRSQTPRGNVAPLDGFVCRVSVDTLSFPLAW